MKKNKIRGANWYKENLTRYRYGILIFNVIVISIVFLIFTGILSIIIEQRFFYNAQNQILNINAEIDKTSYNQIIQNTEGEDPRISVVFYYSDPKDSSVEQFINPIIIGKKVLGIINENNVTSVEDTARLFCA